jgi:hypothetical protein
MKSYLAKKKKKKSLWRGNPTEAVAQDPYLFKEKKKLKTQS